MKPTMRSSATSGRWRTPWRASSSSASTFDTPAPIVSSGEEAISPTAVAVDRPAAIDPVAQVAIGDDAEHRRERQLGQPFGRKMRLPRHQQRPDVEVAHPARRRFDGGAGGDGGERTPAQVARHGEGRTRARLRGPPTAAAAGRPVLRGRSARRPVRRAGAGTPPSECERGAYPRPRRRRAPARRLAISEGKPKHSPGSTTSSSSPSRSRRTRPLRTIHSASTGGALAREDGLARGRRSASRARARRDRGPARRRYRTARGGERKARGAIGDGAGSVMERTAPSAARPEDCGRGGRISPWRARPRWRR